MTERIYSDDVMKSIRRASYRAGADGLSAYSVRGADGPEVVRCRECLRSKEDGSRLLCDHPRCIGFLVAEPDGFCAWGERSEV